MPTNKKTTNPTTALATVDTFKIVPFLDVFPKHTQLYKLMSTKFSDTQAA